MQEHPNYSDTILSPNSFSNRIKPLNFSAFRYVMAPLEGNTDLACRRLCVQNGADVAITEMVRVKSAIHKNKSTWTRLGFHPSVPIIIQLLVSQESEIEEFLKHFIPPENFAGFNLNASCPSMDIVRTGLGCALVKRPAKVQKMIDVIRQFQYPVSVKIRLGLNGSEKKQKVYLRMLQNTTPDFFIVHARHGGQKYVEPADFSIYPECVALGKSIIANGDITSLEQVQNLKKIGVQGVMLGRAALANPSIFLVLQGKNTQLVPIENLRQQYLTLAKEHGTIEEYQKNVMRRLGQDYRTLDSGILR